MNGTKSDLQMSSITSLGNLSEWKENYLLNLLILINIHEYQFLEKKLIKEDVDNIAYMCYNLGRYYNSTQKFLISSKMAKGTDHITTNFTFANAMLKNKNYELADILIKVCLSYIDESALDHRSMRKSIKELQSEIPSLGRPQSMIPSNSCSVNMFESFPLFDLKVSLANIALQNVDSKIFIKHFGYTKGLIDYLQKYNELSSVVLSSIVNKGEPDLQRSFDGVFDFLYRFPPVVLVEKLLSFSSIASMINEVIKRYPDAMLGDSFTAAKIVASSENYSKSNDFLEYLIALLKAKLYNALLNMLNVEKGKLQNTECNLIALQNIVSSCKTIVYTFSFSPEVYGELTKKDAEKLKKIESTYKKTIKDFLHEISQLGMVSCIYIMNIYKQSEFLFQEKESYFCANLKLEVAKIDFFDLHFFFCLLKEAGSKKIPQLIINNSISFGDEIMAFLSSKTIKNVATSEIHLPKRLFLLQIIAHYSHILSTICADDPRVCEIIQELTRYVLLCGGFHVSVIWRLSEIKQIYSLKDSVSLFSWEDGIDSMTGFTSKLLSPYKDQLDLIIKRLCTCRSKDLLQKNLISYVNENHLLFLPALAIKDKCQLVFSLDGNFMGAQMNTHSSKEELGGSDTMIRNTIKEFLMETEQQVKGIMLPTKEMMAECAQRSITLLKCFETSSEDSIYQDGTPMTAQQFIKEYRTPLRTLQKETFWSDIHQQARDTMQKYRAQLQPAVRETERLSEVALWRSLALANFSRIDFPSRVQVQ